MVAAIFSILRNHYRNSHFLHLRETDEPGGPHTVTIQLAEEVSFLNKAALLKELNALPDGTNLTIDSSRNIRIDQDVREIFQDFESTAERRHITVNRVG